MPTLQELLEKDMGFGSEKTASAETAQGSDEMDQLAAQMGFDFGKEAAEEKEEEEGSENEEKEDKEEKHASIGMNGLYNELFPDDADLTEKTAEDEKVAFEMAMGESAYDSFSDRFNKRMEKMASDVLAGNATISSSTAANPSGLVHTDTTPAQAQATNKPADAGDAISTDPTFTDEVKAKNDARTVGHFEQKHAAMNAAMRKHFLLTQIEQ